jgi:hypothetical protein
MSSLVDAVSTLECQEHFAEAINTVQILLTRDPPHLDQAALALAGGRWALRQGGLQATA